MDFRKEQMKCQCLRKEFQTKHFKGIKTIIQNQYIGIRIILKHIVFLIKQQIKRLPEIDTIVFSFRYVSVFDEQALDRLGVIMDNLLKSGRELYFTGLHEQMIEQMKFNQFFKDFIEIKSQNLKFLGK